MIRCRLLRSRHRSMMKIFLALVVLVLIDMSGLRAQRSIDPAQDPMQSSTAFIDIRDRDLRQPVATAQHSTTRAEAHDRSVRWLTAHVPDVVALADIHDHPAPQGTDPAQDETTLMNSSDEHARRSTDLAREVAALIDSVRTRPSSFLPHIDAYYRHVRSFTPSRRALDKAVGEIRKLLAKQKPLAPLTFDSALVRAAIDHLRDTERHALIGHIGSDGSTPLDRVKRYGNQTTIGECITYGQQTAPMILAAFLVDEGTPNRGHRINILGPTYTSVGIATGTHPKYGTTAVVVLAAP